MVWVRTVRADELGAAAAVRFEHGGHAFCIALADGQPRAVDDQCPHRQVMLSGGLVRDGTVICPGHFRRFDLRSGQCVGRPWEKVAQYECSVIDGWVLVDLPPEPPRRSVRDVLLAHARGEQDQDLCPHRPGAA